MKKLGIIFFLISGISLVCLLVMRFLIGGWITYLWVPLILFVVFLIAGFWNFKGLYKEFFTLRTTKEGMSMGAMILMVLTFLGVVNYLGAKKFKTFDFSSAGVNSISEQSKKLAKDLSEDLKVIYFYSRGQEGVEENRRAFIELVKKYQDESAKVKLSFVEVNENPKMAEEFGVNKGSGLVFVQYKDRKSRIEKIDEQELTGAIVKVTREKDKKIYYLIGHRERDFDDMQESMGLGAFKKLLEANRYLVNPLNLTQVPAVPTDADLVIVAAPEQQFLDQELKSLRDYLVKGGSVFMMAKGRLDSGFAKFLSEFGVGIQPHYVVQVMDTPMGKAINPQTTPVNDFNANADITKPFGRGQFVVARLPSSLVKGGLPASMQWTDLVKTDGNAMAFKDTSFKGESTPGPFVIGAVIQGHFLNQDAKEKPFQMVVMSDVDFVSNQLLYKNLNRDLALNSVAFLAKEESIISISPKEVEVTEMQLTDTQFYLFVFGFAIPLPLILIISSGFLWYRRRFA